MKFQKSLFLVGMLCVAVIGLTTGQWLAAAILLGCLEATLTFAVGRHMCCVNSLGTLSSALIVQEALNLVFTKRPILNNISLGLRDLDGSVDSAKKGQAVITRLRTVPSAGNFGDAASARADTDVSVTLSNFKQILYSFTAAEISSTDRNLIRESADPIAVALGNYFVDSIAALWTIAKFPTRTGADAVANGATVTKTIKAAGWDYTHLVNVRGTLNRAGVPDAGRFYVGNSNVYESMLTDLRIVAALNNPDNKGAIATGKLPNVSGMGLDEFPALPTTGNLVGFAGTPDSTAFAVRPPRDPAELLPGAQFPGNSGYITEPRSGLTVRVDEWIGTDLTANIRLSWLDGADVGNPNNGQLIVSQ